MHVWSLVLPACCAPRELFPWRRACMAGARTCTRARPCRRRQAGGWMARLLPWLCNHVRSEHRRASMQAVLPNLPRPPHAHAPSLPHLHCQVPRWPAWGDPAGGFVELCRSRLLMLLDFVARAPGICPGRRRCRPVRRLPCFLLCMHSVSSQLWHFNLGGRVLKKCRLGVAQWRHSSPAPS